MKLRSKLTPGYRAYNGKILTKSDCDYYNRIQDEINRWVAAGRDIPEPLLGQSHLAFNLIIGTLK